MPDALHGHNLFPLGIENGQIRDSSITAPSAVSGSEAKYARLNSGGSWCTDSTANNWLQVDLGRVFTIVAVAVQGSGVKDSLDFVQSYHLSYSSDAATFATVDDLRGRKMVGILSVKNLYSGVDYFDKCAVL